MINSGKKPPAGGGSTLPVWLFLKEPHPLSRSTLPGEAGWHGRRPKAECALKVTQRCCRGILSEFFTCEKLTDRYQQSLRIIGLHVSGAGGAPMLLLNSLTEVLGLLAMVPVLVALAHVAYGGQ